MKLYNQYCYDSIVEVKDSIRSQMSIPDKGIVQTVTSSSGLITVEYLDSNNTLDTYTFNPPNCTQLGFDNTYTGLTTSDAVELGTSATLAFALVWAVKILRRSF